jgi:hypothetical protein
MELADIIADVRGKTDFRPYPGAALIPFVAGRCPGDASSLSLRTYVH